MNITQAILVVLAALIITGCGGKEETPGTAAQKPSLSQGGGTAAAAGGVTWNVPSRWKNAGERPMRVATYIIPSADDSHAECAVFYFGSDQGGDVRSNIDRWLAQFENPSTPVEATREINGMRLTTVTTTGTFLAPSGPMMESQGKKENYTLLAAIVGAPEGSVFFKLTGPAATVSAAKGEFDALLASLK